MSAAIVDTKRYVSFFLTSLDETTSQLWKLMKLLEKEFERPLSGTVTKNFSIEAILKQKQVDRFLVTSSFSKV